MKTEAQSGYVTYTVLHCILTPVLELCHMPLSVCVKAPSSSHHSSRDKTAIIGQWL